MPAPRVRCTMMTLIRAAHGRGHCECRTCFRSDNRSLVVQVAASKLGAASSSLQMLSALAWLQRTFLAEAMAVFPLLLWVRILADLNTNHKPQTQHL